MNKLNYSLLMVALCFVLSGCSKNDRVTTYTFEDRAAEIKFSLTYPEEWTVNELLSWEGDATRDASPTAGIQFDFAEQEGEVAVFHVLAMRFTPVGIPEEPYQTEAFVTDAGQKGIKAILDEETVSVFYILGEDTDPLPQYFGVVNMSKYQYEKYQHEIEQAMKSVVPLTIQ